VHDAIEDVRSVRLGGDKPVAFAEKQCFLDRLDYGGTRGSREGAQNAWRKGACGLAERQVRGPKSLAPFAYAVRLIDHEVGDPEAA